MEENFSSGTAPAAAPEPMKRSKKLIIISAMSLLVVGAVLAFFLAYVVMPKLSREAVDPPAVMGEVGSESPLESAQSTQVYFETGEGVSANWVKNNTENGVIQKGEIQWQVPLDLRNLNLADATAEYPTWVKYVKTGQVSKGKFSGGEMLIVAYYGEGPAFSPEIWKAMLFSGKYIFLGRYSGEFGGEYFNSYIEGLKRTLTGGASPMEFNTDVQVADFDYPATLKGENDRQLLTKKSSNDLFFSSERLRPAFIHPQYGQAYLTDNARFESGEPTKNELNKFGGRPGDMNPFYYEPLQQDYFYFKAADGTLVAYEMKLDILAGELVYGKNAVLNIVWSNGQQNTDLYEVKALGCGSSRAVYNFTGQIDLAQDAAVIGSVLGDNVYGFKDVDNPIFTKYYEQYYVPEGAQKLSKADFLKANPQIFWTDPFGRILSFYRTEFISPAECGKPVIYLYPTEAAEVSVKVAPGNGLTITEPFYDKGWKVWAEPDGQLTNLKDGLKYPYLFWEGNGAIRYAMPEDGFVVDNYYLEKFFAARLEELGLNSKESADFQEFWVPEMRAKQKPYYFVTFLPQSFMDRLAPLRVEPKPDTVIRVMMDWEGLDAHKKVAPQKLEIPSRNGFTVVEWGGMLK